MTTLQIFKTIHITKLKSGRYSIAYHVGKKLKVTVGTKDVTDVIDIANTVLGTTEYKEDILDLIASEGQQLCMDCGDVHYKNNFKDKQDENK